MVDVATAVQVLSTAAGRSATSRCSPRVACVLSAVQEFWRRRARSPTNAIMAILEDAADAK